MAIRIIIDAGHGGPRLRCLKMESINVIIMSSRFFFMRSQN
jgi:hypothetical protein